LQPLSGESFQFRSANTEYGAHLDVLANGFWECLFKPLKEQWRKECHRFYKRNPGVVISKFNFCAVFQEVWLNAILPTNVISGFRKSGVYPFNKHFNYEHVLGDKSGALMSDSSSTMELDSLYFTIKEELNFDPWYHEGYSFPDKSFEA